MRRCRGNGTNKQDQTFIFICSGGEENTRLFHLLKGVETERESKHRMEMEREESPEKKSERERQQQRVTRRERRESGQER